MADQTASAGFAATFLRNGGVLRLALLAVLAALLALIFRDGLTAMATSWARPEYSHGYVIPLVSLYLIWRDRALLAAAGRRGAWSGLVAVALGLAVYVMGELGTIYAVVQYAFLLSIYGLALAFFGWSGMRVLWPPLLYLVFMIPLPQFLYVGLSGDLQLVSSQLGVALIRFFGISVFLDGNVIDLGTYKLQVVEACSGLRYLFPLMSFGFLCAHLYRGPLWHKALFFVSTVPITILMNSFRIGMIGVLFEYAGVPVAEGFLHAFEGWFIFMACLAILLAEVWLLMRLSRMRGSVFDRFQLESRTPAANLYASARRPLPRPYLAALAVVLAGAAASTFLGERAEAALAREPLATLPLRVGDWRGRDLALEREILEFLKVDDYILADFRRAADPVPVNFYVAYYGSQRKGESVHSPQSCIPGDGWQIESFEQVQLSHINALGQPLTVNRVLIGKGDFKQLVYYWFQQRDRILTNEYMVKWFIFWDALTRNRTDGALIRLVTPILDMDGLDAAERRLADFAAAAVPTLAPYLPR